MTTPDGAAQPPLTFSEFDPPTMDEWKETAEKSLKGRPIEKLLRRTQDGVEVRPIYWPADTAGLTHFATLPGEPPFVRGSSDLARPWAVCQELASPTPEELRATAQNDLARGQTALGLVLDGPTRRGLDPDQAPAEEVGEGGLSLSSLGDLEVTLAELDEALPPVHVDAGATALPVLSLFGALLEGRRAELSGCIGADPLGELAATGALPLPLEAAYDHLAASARWARQEAPALRTVLVRGCPYHEAGASAVEELAMMMATGAAYLRALSARGLEPGEAARQIRFTTSLGRSFFAEVAKLRAARLLWTQIVSAFGGDPSAQAMELHGRTSRYTQTALDPYVNMLRNTTEALSAVLGGVSSLHVRPFDEPLRPSSEFSRRVSRNVQLLLQRESHLTQPADPLGGAWYVEALTDGLAREAWALFQEIEAAGGMAEALIRGVAQERIAETARARARSLETRRDVLVGTNKYANLDERKVAVPEVDADARRAARLEALERYRTSISSIEAHTEALDRLAGAGGHAEAAPLELAIAAVKAGATVGDVMTALTSDAAGAAPEVTPLARGRAAEPYEALRQAAEEAAGRRGQRTPIFLANLGPLSQHKARADFSLAFFEVGGFAPINPAGFEGPAEAAEAALASGAPIVVICSTDERYPEAVPPLARAIKGRAPEVIVILAGKPASPELDEAYREAGLDEAIHLGSDCYGLLRRLQERTLGANHDR